jgi:DNA polymerase V
MFADNEQGQILKQKFGDAMSSPQKAGVRFIPTTNPESRKIPVMLSPVRAGLPAWASDSIGTEVDINSLYHEKSYFVVAHGDSMTGARIQEGDWLLVDEAKAPKSSDIVVAEIDGALTVKRLKKNGVTWLLHPDSENPAYAPMEFGEGMRIVGVVVQIIVQP